MAKVWHDPRQRGYDSSSAVCVPPLAGPSRARLLTRLVVGEPLVNLELHGIDVLDADDGFPELRGHQPDVRVPHARKLEALSAVLETLRAAGYSFVRLDEAAKAFA